LFLNTHGIEWGLPAGELYHHSFHPDEQASLLATLAINMSERTLYATPYAFVNGSMHYYVVLLVYHAAYGLDLESVLQTMNVAKLRSFYLLARWVTVIMSLAAALVLYFIAKKVAGKYQAAITMLIFVSLPAVTVNSHYFRPHIPSVLWILLAFLMCVSIVKSGKRWSYVLAGIFAGCATATLYPSVLIFLTLLSAHVMHVSRRSARQGIAKYVSVSLLCALGAGVVSFFVCAPCNILYAGEVFSNLIRQFSFQTGTFLYSMGREPSWLGWPLRVFPFAMTMPMLLLSAAGIIYAAWRRTRTDLLILSWVVPYYVLLCISTVWVVRYTVPLMPFFALANSRLLVDVYKKTQGITRYFAVCAGALIVLIALLYSITLDSLMTKPDPRIEAYYWIEENIAPGSVIGYEWSPAASFSCINETRFQPVKMRMDIRKLDTISYYVANDQISLHYPRLAEYFPARAAFLETMLRGELFEEVAVFDNTSNLVGIAIQKKTVPHDYMYFMPRITVLRKVIRQ
jgi:hypothetical protein